MTRNFRSAGLKTVVAGTSSVLMLAATIFLSPSLLNEGVDDSTILVSVAPPPNPTSLKFQFTAGTSLLPPPGLAEATEESSPSFFLADQLPSQEPDFSHLLEVPSAAEPNETEQQPMRTPLAARTGGPVTKLIRSAHLKASLDEVFADGQAGLILVDPNAEETLFSYGGDEVFTAASVYKLFVAYSILKKVDEEAITPSTFLAGTTVSGCLIDMITYSDNECAAEWLSQESYFTITELAHSIGAGNTSFDYGDIETTPADVAAFLTLLYRGELLGETSNELLLTLMKNQIFRDGIPSVLEPTSVVADKIGFLDGLSHDAAIVYSPKGDYILVIFTDELSEMEIAEAATIIDEWL